MNQTQVDQNGIVYDPKTDHKCLKNGAFTAVYSVYTAVFGPYHTVLSGAEIRAVLYAYRKVTVNGRKHAVLYTFTTVYGPFCTTLGAHFHHQHCKLKIGDCLTKLRNDKTL
jgi:hypothetical protein